MLEEGIVSPLRCHSVPLKTGLNLVQHVRWQEAPAASTAGRIWHTLTGPPAYEKENLERNVKKRREKPTHENINTFTKCKYGLLEVMQQLPAMTVGIHLEIDSGDFEGASIYTRTHTITGWHNISSGRPRNSANVRTVKAIAIDSIFYFFKHILGWSYLAPQILGLSSGEEHYSEVPACVCACVFQLKLHEECCRVSA